MNVIEKIEQLQAGKEGTAPWMVGQQLKDICRNDQACAAIVLEDLENEAMSLEACEKKIKVWADQQKRRGNCVCVPPQVAEKIIREFYGLPEAGAKIPAQPQKKDEPVLFGLEDLLA